MSHAFVLQPPPGDLTGPCAGPAYLKAYAREHGFDVWTRDVGIDAFHYLIEPHRVRDMVDRADFLRGRLESKGALEPFDQRWYGLLLMAAGFGLDPERISDAVSGFRDQERFHNYPRYRIDCKVLDAFFRLLRAVYYPTMVTPGDYPSAHALKTADAIRLHLDEDINPYVAYYREVLVPTIAEARPSVVGISMTYAAQSVQALVLGMLLKQELPEIHITMGGSYLTQWVLVMDEPALSFLFSATDSVICGEGEISFAGILEAQRNGASPADVPNLIFKEEGTGRILRSDAFVFHDLTQQPPPDYSDLDLSVYLIPEPVLPYMLTRGCAWQRCGFCQNRVGKHHPRPYQAVPVDKAVAELTALARTHGCRHFHFCGDMIDVEYLKAFSRSLVDAKTSIFWHTNLRADEASSQDLCAQLAGAGLQSVAMGVESGSQKTLDRMEKGLDIRTLGETLHNLHQAGVATQVTGMLGFPGESEAEAQMTVQFVMEHVQSISSFDVGLLLVLPGSPMHDDPSRFGVHMISYEHARLMTPEPLWKAARRISLAAVDRLFEQLGRLEAASFLLNDRPYVGALCSNHSLLYFMHGAHILKHLRALENFEHQAVRCALGMDLRGQQNADMRSLIPQFRFPCMIYRSPYPHERAHFAAKISKDQRRLVSGPGWDYLQDPINIPQLVSPEVRRMLERIDGQRDLVTVLGEHCSDGGEEGLFLARLILSGLVVLADNTPRQEPGR